jgi:cytochrome c oxidase subunit 2
MPVQWMVGIAFVLMAGSLVAVFATIAFDSRAEAWEGIYQRGGRLRRGWFIGLLVFAIVVFALSMTWLPYGLVRSAQLPGDATEVGVTARQFAFALDTDCLPADTPIEFAVQSADVNHGFAVYDPDGHLVAQVQAMPGFTNELRTSFSKPGPYTVICDELCGPAHSFMRGEFTVGGCGGSAAAGCGGGACA